MTFSNLLLLEQEVARSAGRLRTNRFQTPERSRATRAQRSHRRAIWGIVALLDSKRLMALFIRQRVTYKYGDSPTSSRKRMAKAVRDIPT